MCINWTLQLSSILSPFHDSYIYRTVYPDFVHRFIIIKPKEVHAAQPDLKQCTKIILESIEAMNDKWRLGHTKVGIF